MSKRVLGTGGEVFLGQYSRSALLKDGCEVIGIDSYFTGRRKNIDAYLDDRAVEVMPIPYQHNAVQTAKTSVMGAINLLGRAKRLRVLQASTSERYGDLDVKWREQARSEGADR